MLFSLLNVITKCSENDRGVASFSLIYNLLLLKGSDIANSSYTYDPPLWYITHLILFLPLIIILMVKNEKIYKYFLCWFIPIMLYSLCMDYMKKIALTKYRIRWIAKVKDVYDFSTQIENDFLILSIMAIRSVIVKNKKAPASFVIARIREICQHPEFVKTRKAYHMESMPLSVRVYLLLIRLHLYPVCYVCGRLFLK